VKVQIKIFCIAAIERCYSKVISGSKVLIQIIGQYGQANQQNDVAEHAGTFVIALNGHDALLFSLRSQSLKFNYKSRNKIHSKANGNQRHQHFGFVVVNLSWSYFQFHNQLIFIYLT